MREASESARLMQEEATRLAEPWTPGFPREEKKEEESNLEEERRNSSLQEEQEADFSLRVSQDSNFDEFMGECTSLGASEQIFSQPKALEPTQGTTPPKQVVIAVEEEEDDDQLDSFLHELYSEQV